MLVLFQKLLKVICYQETNNIGMRNLFGATKTQPFINFKDENIYFFHDCPHIIKSVRKNIKNTILVMTMILISRFSRFL